MMSGNPRFGGRAAGLGGIGQGAFEAGDDWHARARRQAARRRLVPQHVQQIGARSDERDPGRLAGARQRGVLRQEPVAGMDEPDALFLRQGHDTGHVEVGLDRSLALADLVGLVGLEPVQAERILFRKHRHRAQAQLRGRAHDADGNLPPIECKQFVHGQRLARTLHHTTRSSVARPATSASDRIAR